MKAPMPTPDQPTVLDEKWFTQDLTDSYPDNRRKSTRYVRNDIGVTVRKVKIFNFSFITDWGVSVKLFDISSRGALISSPMRLTVNKKIHLIIRFSDFTEFEVAGTIVRKSPGNDYIYGVKFDHINNDLADHLISTQRKLVFR